MVRVSGAYGEYTWTAKDKAADPNAPVVPDKEEPGNNEDKTDDKKDETKKDTVPKTGDATAMLPWLAVLAVAAGGAGTVVYRKNK